MASLIDRRDFLIRAGVHGAVAAAALGQRVSPNEQIGLGIIGTGDLARGWHMRKVLTMPELRIVALADVDREHLEDAERIADGKAVPYTDYRRLLERSDVDAVLIATPDHWHALTAIHACEAGKDVYCEKPLSLTIAEGRDMVRAARRYRRVFQVGTQQRSDRRFRRACELVRNGAIGRVIRVTAVLGQGPSAERVADSAPPAHLDWNFWLGPAPVVPYNVQRCHYNFRWFFDYSGGKFTDWGAHHLDIVQWGLGTELSGPVEVEARGTFPGDNAYETPVDFDAWFQYPDGVTLHVSGEGENGVTFFGTEGEIFVSRGTIRANPAEILQGDAASLPLQLYRSDDHHQNWVACLRSRQRPVSDVELGHRSATVCHLANIAMKLGRRLRWDPERESFPGDDAANRLVSKPKRHPWSS